jgi:hypothetical protein
MLDPSFKSQMQRIGRGTCDGCKFWSASVAAVIGNGPEALCLNRESHKYLKMTSGGCDKHEAGHPVDDPEGPI